MKKAAILLIAGLFLGLGVLGAVLAEEAMTRLQFAQSLAQQLGVTLPPGSENLPQDEYFNLLANALAAKGINNFVGSNPAATVTFGEMVNVLYVVVGGTDATLDAGAKADYLVSGGYLASPPANLGASATLSDMQNIFNSPLVASVIVETYTEPAGDADAGGDTGDNTPDGETENPSETLASQT